MFTTHQRSDTVGEVGSQELGGGVASDSLLAKIGLQHLATAAALNLDRLAAWLTERPLAPTRVSRFAALLA